MKPTVFVTRRLPEGAMAVLDRHFEVRCNPHDRVLTREELLEGVRGQQGLLPLLTDHIDDAVMGAAGKQLRIIANYAVGFDNIDVAAATARGIAVGNTPGVLTDTTADLTMALILTVSRRIVEGDAYARAGKYQGWAPELLLGRDVHHQTLGLMGFGRIGQAVARRAVGFDMRILYHARHRVSSEKEARTGARYVDQKTLLREADIISLHVPLTARTRHLIGADELSMMKPTAFLINTARGEVVDEAALAEALEADRMAGAGLDVFEQEPRIHPALTGMNQVVLLPHVGSASVATRTRMGEMAAENLMAVLLKDQQPPHCVNPEIYR
ncbi:MAG: 2-hydroxyacid dehydrogenase [Desulfobacteraceae bacterium]